MGNYANTLLAVRTAQEAKKEEEWRASDKGFLGT